MKKTLSLVGLAIGLFWGPSAALAGPVDFTLTGEVTAVNNSDFNLPFESSFSFDGMFNDDVINEVGETVIRFDGTVAGNMFSMNVDGTSFDNTMDAFQDNLSPIIVLLDGAFSGFFFFATLGVNNAPTDTASGNGTFWSIFNSGLDFGVVTITWQSFSTSPKTSVPEPASMVIFGLGLLGFGAARRRRRLG